MSRPSYALERGAASGIPSEIVEASTVLNKRRGWHPSHQDNGEELHCGVAASLHTQGRSWCEDGLLSSREELCLQFAGALDPSGKRGAVSPVVAEEQTKWLVGQEREAMLCM